MTERNPAKLSPRRRGAPITRRSLIQTTAGLLFAAPAIKSSRASANDGDFDVIIIGAGIAGIAAARHLADLGYSVVVLEAKDRTGGRIHTDRRLGAPFEAGAGWIHRPRKNPISDLAAKVGAPTFHMDFENDLVFSGAGKRQSKKWMKKKYEELKGIYKRIDDRFDRDQSLEKAIARTSRKGLKDPTLRWMASAYTEFSTGGPLDTLSAYYFDEDDEFWGEDVILPQGYDKIFGALTHGLDVRLNTAVKAVEYEEGDGATVRTSNGIFESDFVICTVPLGALKQETIIFDPPLPKSYRQRIARIGMGNVTKLALKFKEPFWPLDTHFFGFMGRQKGRWNVLMNYRTFSEENILMAFSVGNYPVLVERMNDTDMIADCMDAVRTMFGQNVPEPVDHLTTRWSQDRFTRGAYSYPRVGTKPSDFDNLAKPVAKTVLLAGEHTNFDYHGTTHGAYLSGVWAAKTIDDDLAE